MGRHSPHLSLQKVREGQEIRGGVPELREIARHYLRPVARPTDEQRTGLGNGIKGHHPQAGLEVGEGRPLEYADFPQLRGKSVISRGKVHLFAGNIQRVRNQPGVRFIRRIAVAGHDERRHVSSKRASGQGRNDRGVDAAGQSDGDPHRTGLGRPLPQPSLDKSGHPGGVANVRQTSALPTGATIPRYFIIA